MAEKPEGGHKREPVVPKASVALAPRNAGLEPLLKEMFGPAQPEFTYQVDEVAVRVPPERLLNVMETCKRDPRLAMDYLRCLSIVEYPQHFQAVYHLYSMRKRHKMAVKVNTPKDNPVFPSIASVWRAADWHEREGAELFGVTFQGHPDPRPLLLFEEFAGVYPLRKSHPFEEIDEWKGDRW